MAVIITSSSIIAAGYCRVCSYYKMTLVINLNICVCVGIIGMLMTCVPLCHASVLKNNYSNLKCTFLKSKCFVDFS